VKSPRFLLRLEKALLFLFAGVGLSKGLSKGCNFKAAGGTLSLESSSGLQKTIQFFWRYRDLIGRGFGAKLGGKFFPLQYGDPHEVGETFFGLKFRRGIFLGRGASQI